MSGKKESLAPARPRAGLQEGSSEVGSPSQELAEFRAERRARRAPRIVFAYDVTGSRRPTWELATKIHQQLINEVLEYGDVSLKVVAFRDRFADPDEYLIESDWSDDSSYLSGFMAEISCRGGGGNQGESVDAALEVALRAGRAPRAVVLVGDEPVVPQSRDRAFALASRLGKQDSPVLAFQEGERRQTEMDFRRIADLSGGVYSHLSERSSVDLGDHIRVATVFAAGGERAVSQFLEARKQNRLSPGAQKLAQHLLEARRG